jgi:hypothetical protein
MLFLVNGCIKTKSSDITSCVFYERIGNTHEIIGISGSRLKTQEERRGKVFVDYVKYTRNEKGETIASEITRREQTEEEKQIEKIKEQNYAKLVKETEEKESKILARQLVCSHVRIVYSGCKDPRYSRVCEDCKLMMSPDRAEKFMCQQRRSLGENL